MAFAQSSLMASSNLNVTPPLRTPVPPPTRPRSSMFSTRSLKQLGLFTGGASFLLLSSLITRRALTRKLHATRPAFYNFTSQSAPPSPGAIEALEALTIATSYVLSSAVMLIGGGLWAFDISSVEEFRSVARWKMYGAHGVGDDGEGRKVDEEAEKEIEEWMAGVLAKKEVKEMAKEMARGPPKGLGEKYGWPKGEGEK